MAQEMRFIPWDGVIKNEEVEIMVRGGSRRSAGEPEGHDLSALPQTSTTVAVVVTDIKA